MSVLRFPLSSFNPSYPSPSPFVSYLFPGLLFLIPSLAVSFYPAIPCLTPGPFSSCLLRARGGEERRRAVGKEGEEENVFVPYSEFMNLANMAGLEINDDEFVATVDQVNFQ